MPVTTQKATVKRSDRHRRRHARYRCDFPVTVTYLFGDRFEKFEGHCRDLSEAGIGILIAAELTQGEVVSLDLKLPGSTLAWDLRAVVRYRSGYQYGFEFLSLAPAHRDSIVKFLQTQKPLD